MYKVFMNDKPIILTDCLGEKNKYQVVEFDKFKFDMLQELMSSNTVEGICLISKSLANDWVSFKENFKVIEAAGGKVYNANAEILFIYRFDTWDLPKGHIEKGEDKQTAAIREVEEECGISGLEIQKELETTYHIFFTKKGEICLKVTFWFQMQTGFNGTLIPQTEEGISDVVFKDAVATKQALKNTYENIKLLF